MTDSMEAYFDRLDAGLEAALDVARRARSLGLDPATSVEIPVAKDMADRVENLLEIPGVAERVRELESEMSREEAVLALAEDFATGRVGAFETREETIEGAVRTAVALLTEGVVAAPIEGIDGVEILTNDDGTEFVNVYYAGPIRSAGGTAQALSVLVADYVRTELGLEAYQARPEEVERYAEELALYDDETGLQYSPSDGETRFIAEHLPVMLDGEPTGDDEVSGYRDVDRVDTNAARGGMCLVLGEGIAQKANKIERYTAQLEAVDWPWLDELTGGLESGEGDRTREDSPPDDEAATGPPRMDPSDKYLEDLIAGRPVLSHPSTEGGFRLRYGRARNHGFATAGIHPATMHLVDDFLATGTQLKTERPGKAAGVVPVDSIEGPTVRLATGEVRRIDDPAEALEVRNGVERIIDLGEYLVNYGEFVENNHPLAPAGYAVEWWIQEFEAAGGDRQALEDDPHVDLECPAVRRALEWAQTVDAPLHPAHTYQWHDLDVAGFDALADAITRGEIRADGTLVCPADGGLRSALETIVVEHRLTDGEIEVDEPGALLASAGLEVDDGTPVRIWALEDLSRTAREWDDGDNAIRAVNEVAPFTVRERAPTRVGARMGRPEKSERREMQPAVHTLFPIADAGGAQRDVEKAATGDGPVTVTVARLRCPDCDLTTVSGHCPECGGHTTRAFRCESCDRPVPADGDGRPACPACDEPATAVARRELDLGDHFRSALESVGERATSFEILKGVKGLTSAAKRPEPMEKGILRAKHGVSMFKDGTIRYDMTDLPVTAVRPDELAVTADQLRRLGYETDVHGDPLRHDDQLVELKVQDVVLSEGAAEHMLQTATFVDDLLERFYDMDPFYEVDDRRELVGELVFGMAPHTSAAVVGRIVGFTSAAVGYAHPYFHAAKRRNCFHPETSIAVRGPDGARREVTVASLVESALTDPRRDADGTLVQELDGAHAVPSIDGAGRPVERPVEAVSRHPAPAHLLCVRTAGGRSLTVTHDHTMLVWDGGLERRPASAIEPGDAIPVRDPDGAAAGADRAAVADGGPEVDPVVDVEIVSTDVEYTYCLTVSDTHALVADGCYVGQCDGDEDCVMLLMDGLLNFSRSYLPDKRGGSMDAPLVMSSRIDPAEIDDEAHNVDVVDHYPRSFYEATRELAHPDTVDIETAGDSVGTPTAHSGFGFTHDTSDVALGPDLSAYKTLGAMTEKLDAQLDLARKLAAVDDTDVAERVIEYHLLPDLMGNLRAFSSQESRCQDCGWTFRRMPLTMDCPECGGNVTLTVHEGGVTKYLRMALETATEYGCRPYTKQRLEVLERSIESIFQNDKNRPSSLEEFM